MPNDLPIFISNRLMQRNAKSVCFDISFGISHFNAISYSLIHFHLMVLGLFCDYVSYFVHSHYGKISIDVRDMLSIYCCFILFTLACLSVVCLSPYQSVGFEVCLYLVRHITQGFTCGNMKCTSYFFENSKCPTYNVLRLRLKSYILQEPFNIGYLQEHTHHVR